LEPGVEKLPFEVPFGRFAGEKTRRATAQQQKLQKQKQQQNPTTTKTTTKTKTTTTTGAIAERAPKNRRAISEKAISLRGHGPRTPVFHEAKSQVQHQTSGEIDARAHVWQWKNRRA
jgi:hypothetical protein